MQCQNPALCSTKAKMFENKNSRHLEKGQQLFDELKEDYKIDGSRHFDKRALERSIGRPDLMTVINYGWVIEYHPREKKFLILGYTREYRPIHLVVLFIDEALKVVTVYSPRNKPWKWCEEFKRRICFCEN